MKEMIIIPKPQLYFYYNTEKIILNRYKYTQPTKLKPNPSMAVTVQKWIIGKKFGNLKNGSL